MLGIAVGPLPLEAQSEAPTGPTTTAYQPPILSATDLDNLAVARLHCTRIRSLR